VCHKQGVNLGHDGRLSPHALLSASLPCFGSAVVLIFVGLARK
jgi:hypothetical protein